MSLAVASDRGDIGVVNEEDASSASYDRRRESFPPCEGTTSIDERGCEYVFAGTEARLIFAVTSSSRVSSVEKAEVREDAEDWESR